MKKKGFICLVCLGLLLHSSAFSQGGALNEGKDSPFLLIRSERVFLGHGPGIKKNVDILCKGDRIHQVGQGIEAPPGAKVIHAPGTCAMPGLIDTHVYLFDGFLVSPIYLFLAWGVTTVRDMENSALRIQGLKELIDSGQVLGPRIVFSGEALTHIKQRSPFQIPLEEPERARSAVKKLLEQGAEFLLLSSGVNPEIAEAALKEAKSQDLPVAVDLLESHTLNALEAVRLDITSLERMGGVPQAVCGEDFLQKIREKSTLFDWLNKVDAQEHVLIKEMVNRGVYLVPTLVAFEANALPEDLALAEREGTQGLPQTAWDHWDNARAQQKECPWWPAACLLHLRYSKDFIRKAARAGVKILAGSATPTPGVPPGYGLLRELELLVEAGLEPATVLSAATLEAARCLGKDQDLGTLEPGKFADIIILEGDPIADISMVKRIKWVIKGGKVVPRQDIPGFE